MYLIAPYILSAPFHMASLAYVHIVTGTLCLVNLYLMHGRERNAFDRVLYFSSYAILVHVLNAFVTRQYFPDAPWLDVAPPFGLMYGPLFYFGFRVASGRRLGVGAVLLHSFPFLLFSLACIGFYLDEDFRDGYILPYYTVMYSSVCISMVSYTVWGMVKGTERQGYLSQFVSRMGVMLMIVSLLTVFMMYGFLVENTIVAQHTSTPLLIIYAVLLCVVWFIFRYNIGRLVYLSGAVKEPDEGIPVRRPLPEAAYEDAGETENAVPQYRKSSLSAEMLEEYAKNLHRAMTEKKVYLQAELSLVGLAKELKIPKHHLTQLFSVHIGRNFYQYVNTYRVDYACRMLVSKTDPVNLEELAFDCGFNSKTSFNRYFKAQMNCTPSEYRDRHRN